MQDSNSDTKWARRVEAGAVLASRLPAWAATLITLAGLCASWGIVYLLGGSGRVAPHFFYFPILFAASRSGHAGVLATAIASALLAGPLMPADVETSSAQEFSDWASRGAFFVVIGLHMSLVAVRLKRSASRELRMTREIAELATHKAAVIQNVTHEFRTPLTIISGMAATLERPGFVSERARPLVEGIRRAVERLAVLVEGVVTTALALGRDSRILQQVRIDLARTFRRLADKLEEFGGPSRVQVNIEPGAETIMTSVEFLEVALRCLLENSLKFSPLETPVELSARRDNDSLEILLRDHGPGISPEFLTRAFDPFTQLDESTTRERAGLGLGLFAAKSVVIRLGGTIIAREASDGGTEMVIRFPQKRGKDRVTSLSR
jgi:signal transduction histidine kinase